MSIDTSHLLDAKAEPPSAPEPKPPLEVNRFLAGDGLGVVQSDDSVMYYLTEGVKRRVQAIEQTIAGSKPLNFGFKTTVEVVNADSAIGNVTIAEGVINDVNWALAGGWVMRDHVIEEGVLNNVQFPCLIYGKVTIETLTSTNESRLETVQTIESNDYRIVILNATRTKRVRTEALPDYDDDETGPSVYLSQTAAATPSDRFFMFRVAEIDDAGAVTAQYAVGSVTMPQIANPFIQTLSIART